MNILQGKVDCAPADVGYEASRLEAVNAFFSRMIEQNTIFGVAYRLARRGKTFASAAIGSRHYRKPDELMQPDTVFRIASQTKTFTATAIQIFVEDGLLAIEDKVAKYLPQFDGPPYDQITIFHLLTHTSGMYPESEAAMPDKHLVRCYGHIEQQFEKDGMDTDWIAAGLRGGLRRPPGSEWQYCNFGFQLLGAVIEKASGMTAPEFIESRICKPLGMNDTGYAPTVDMARRAVIFDKYTEEKMEDIIQGKPREKSFWDILPSTAGGLTSSVDDILRYGVMLQQGGRLGDTRVLGRKAVESMTTQKLSGVPDYCWGGNYLDHIYGLGWEIGWAAGALPSSGTFKHEGAGHSVLIVDPKEELVCVCVYPWVNGQWNADCNNRLFNVIWSGLI